MTNVSKFQLLWNPQVSIKSFIVEISSREEGLKLYDILARYDLFQFENKIKPDCCNAGFIQFSHPIVTKGEWWDVTDDADWEDFAEKISAAKALEASPDAEHDLEMTEFDDIGLKKAAAYLSSRAGFGVTTPYHRQLAKETIATYFASAAPPPIAKSKPSTLTPALRPDHQTMETAPRNGTLIFVIHEDCGEFLMHWGYIQKNGIFAPGEIGMWVSPDGQFTWTERDNLGPSHWRPAHPQKQPFETKEFSR